jgi:hypothetical protein
VDDAGSALVHEQELVPGKVLGRLYRHEIETPVGQIPCWTYLTRGLPDVGQSEIRLTVQIHSDFFQALGRGRVTLDRVGNSGLAIHAIGWAEADPNANVAFPSCHLSAGLLAAFVGRLGTVSTTWRWGTGASRVSSSQRLQAARRLAWQLGQKYRLVARRPVCLHRRPRWPARAGRPIAGWARDGVSVPSVQGFALGVHVVWRVARL